MPAPLCSGGIWKVKQQVRSYAQVGALSTRCGPGSCTAQALLRLSNPGKLRSLARPLFLRSTSRKISSSAPTYQVCAGRVRQGIPGVRNPGSIQLCRPCTKCRESKGSSAELSSKLTAMKRQSVTKAFALALLFAVYAGPMTGCATHTYETTGVETVSDNTVRYRHEPGVETETVETGHRRGLLSIIGEVITFPFRAIASIL